MEDWGEYLRAKEPGMRERAYAWKTAIGLQKVDGLTPSAFLVETARRNIEGEITLAESRDIVTGYHRAKKRAGGEPKDRSSEADIVAQHITEVLAEDSFTFSPEELVSIHKRLFDGVFEFAGKIRDYDISKEEWVLKGASVSYGSAYRLMETLAFDFREEREFSYIGLSEDALIRRIAHFTANLWQIHAFGEGNTRTTGVFIIKYLRTLGFDVQNDVFADNAWYFRNALVRANYSNIPKGVEETPQYLETFFRNLLLGEQNVLQSRYLIIGGWQGGKEDPTSNPTSNPTSKPMREIRPGLQLSDQVRRLLCVIDGEMTRAAIMKALKLKDRVTFANSYLGPVLKIGLVEMTQPNSPRSPTQRYRLTAQGRTAQNGEKSVAKISSCIVD